MTAQHYTKKGQIHIAETLAVLFIFLIILSFSLYFYYQYTAKGIEKRGLEFAETESATLLYAISSTPELSCREENCIDTSKLIGLKKLNYKFLKKEIKIELLYPEPTSQQECTILNYPNCKYWLLKSVVTSKNPLKISSPISLYYPIKDEYKLGKITITVY